MHHSSAQAVPVPGASSSGLTLSRTEGIGEMFTVAGHRTVVIGKEGASCEVWTYPFQAAQSISFSLVSGGNVTPLEGCCTSFEVRPEASVAKFRLPDAAVTLTMFAPIGQPVALFMFNIDTSSDAELVAEVKTDLKLMWPAESVPRDVETLVDRHTGAMVVRSGSDAAIFGWAGTSCGLVADGFPAKRIPAGGSSAALVVAGSVASAEDARMRFDRAIENFSSDWDETVSYYSLLLSQNAALVTSDASLDEAYRWAVVGLDKCYVETPGLGGGYVAGYNLSGEGARNGFGWYFGRDSSWTGFAAACFGDFEHIRSNIRLMAKYQIREGENRGKIYHELSAAHDRLGGERQYAFPAGDSTPFFVADIAHYYRWTGDGGFVQEMWDALEMAMDWCYRMDVDGDLLIDNPPAGHQWYDYGEKNMVDLVAIWHQALEGAAYLGEVVGRGDAAKWKADAGRVRQMLNADFWNEPNSYLYDRKLPDGSMLGLTTCNPTIPLLWQLIDPEKAERAVERMGQPDLVVDWGLRTNSDVDEIFVPHGYHEGTVWPLCTGWGSLAAFANGDAELGWKLLKANADMTRDWCLGYLAEVVDGGQRVPGGCPHQAWSEAMVILPVAQGIFGLRPLDGASGIEVTAALPEALERAELANIRIGSCRYGVRLERTGAGVRVTVTASEPGKTLDIGAITDSVSGVGLNGQEVPASEVSREPRGHMLRVSTTLMSETAAVEVEIGQHWPSGQVLEKEYFRPG